MEQQIQRKPKILCFHGYRSSGEILKNSIFQWSATVLGELDLVFLDAPYLAQDMTDIEGTSCDPLYEWFRVNQDFSEFTEMEGCFTFIEDFMMKNGPFDGLLGCSQGAMLSAALPGMQRDGIALTRVPKIKFVMMISGSRFGGSMFPHHKMTTSAFSSPLELPSLHIIVNIDDTFLIVYRPKQWVVGERDFLRVESIDLPNYFVDPFVINHPEGHIIPKLDEKNVEVMLRFIQQIKGPSNRQ